MFTSQTDTSPSRPLAARRLPQELKATEVMAPLWKERSYRFLYRSIEGTISTAQRIQTRIRVNRNPGKTRTERRQIRGRMERLFVEVSVTVCRLTLQLTVTSPCLSEREKSERFETISLWTARTSVCQSILLLRIGTTAAEDGLENLSVHDGACVRRSYVWSIGM